MIDPLDIEYEEGKTLHLAAAQVADSEQVPVAGEPIAVDRLSTDRHL
jgi:hypothetical protein